MFTNTNRHQDIGQQPGTKIASRPGDKPRINRCSTARFVPPTVYIGFPLFVPPKSCSGQLFSMPWRAGGTVVSCTDKSVVVLPCRTRPAQPPRRAPLDPTRPWCVRVVDPTSQDSLRTRGTVPRDPTFDPIFASEDRRWWEILRFSDEKIEDRGRFFDLRTRRSKIREGSSIFGDEDRR